MKKTFYFILVVFLLVVDIKVKAQTVVFTTPTNTTSWQAGTQQTVSLTSTQAVSINLKLYKNDSYVELIAPLNLAVGTNTYDWNIPNYLVPGNDYFLLCLVNGVKVQSEKFEIVAAPPSFTEIHCSQSMFNGKEYSINARFINISNITIEYSLDGSTNWQTITTTPQISGDFVSYDWTVAGITGINPNAKIRFRDSNDPNISISETVSLSENSPFSIILTPSTGGQYPIGSYQNIKIENNGGAVHQWAIYLYKNNSQVLPECKIILSLASNSITDIPWAIDPALYSEGSGYTWRLGNTQGEFVAAAISGEFEITQASSETNIVISQNPINFGTVSVGSSVMKKMGVTGNNLTGNISLSIPPNTGFLLSSVGGSLVNSLVFTGSGYHEFFLNFAPTTATAYLEELTITSPGATTLKVPMSGNAIVDIQETSNDNILLFPNPTDGIINIKAYNNIYKIIISDVSGRPIIIRDNMQLDEKIDLSFFERGIYLVSIQTENKIFVKKIIKE